MEAWVIGIDGPFSFFCEGKRGGEDDCLWVLVLFLWLFVGWMGDLSWLFVCCVVVFLFYLHTHHTNQINLASYVCGFGTCLDDVLLFGIFPVVE